MSFFGVFLVVSFFFLRELNSCLDGEGVFFFFFVKIANEKLWCVRSPFRFIGYLQKSGFHKEKEIAFPFKQAALMKIQRESWVCPAI